MLQPQDDHLYFEARAEREIALARSAPHPEAARAHTILARLYLDRLGSVANPALFEAVRP
jgi:hypothetical protein